MVASHRVAQHIADETGADVQISVQAFRKLFADGVLPVRFRTGKVTYISTCFLYKSKDWNVTLDRKFLFI